RERDEELDVAQQVARDHRVHGEARAVAGDHAQAEQALAGGRAVPEDLEKREVEVADEEEADEHQRDRLDEAGQARDPAAHDGDDDRQAEDERDVGAERDAARDELRQREAEDHALRALELERAHRARPCRPPRRSHAPSQSALIAASPKRTASSVTTWRNTPSITPAIAKSRTDASTMSDAVRPDSASARRMVRVPGSTIALPSARPAAPQRMTAPISGMPCGRSHPSSGTSRSRDA